MRGGRKTRFSFPGMIWALNTWFEATGLYRAEKAVLIECRGQKSDHYRAREGRCEDLVMVSMKANMTGKAPYRINASARPPGLARSFM
jgi:hypothetical protein